MGNFFIWIGVSIVFGLVCGLVYTWIDASLDKEQKSGASWSIRRILVRSGWFAVAGLILAAILNIVFAG